MENSMIQTVIVFGPMKSGKTSGSMDILRHFRIRKVVDDWDPSWHRLVPGAVHLTNASADEIGEQPCPIFHISSLALPEQRTAARPDQFVDARRRD